MIKINVKFNDTFDEKLFLNSGNSIEDVLDRVVDHVTHDAENICRREAPIDTGNLRRSIHKRRPGKCQGELSARGAPYWVYLQYGTSKMNANPFVTRTANKIKSKIPDYVKEELT